MSTNKPIDRRGYRVLYMEDDEGIARLMEKALVRQGFIVDIARDGKEGLELFRSRSYDVICIDHNMPELKGLDVLNIMKSEGELPPTIMITGHGNEEIAVEAMKLGLDDYIVKDTGGRFLDMIPMVVEKVAYRHRESRERELAQRALRVIEDKYRIVVENLTQYLVVVQDGVVKFINDRLLERFEEEDLLTKGFAQFVHPDDRGLVREHSGDGVNRPDAPESLAFRALDRQGGVRWMEGNSVLIEWEGAPATMYSFADVTERRVAEERLVESQRRLDFIINNVRDIVYVLDRFGNYTFLSKSHEEYFSYTRQELIGTNIAGLISKDSLEKAVEYLPKIMAGQELGLAELDVLDKDGKILTVQFLVRPVHKDGEIDEYVGVSRVVGMRKVTEGE